MGKRINLGQYPNIIAYLNKTINKYKISLHFLERELNIPRVQIRRILNTEISSTGFDLLSFYKIVKSFEKKENQKKADKTGINYSEEKKQLFEFLQPLNFPQYLYCDKILFLLAKLKKIRNFHDFFNDIFFLVNDEKISRMYESLELLVKYLIIEIKDDILTRGERFFYPELSRRTQNLYINYALNYFEREKQWEEGFFLSLICKNSRCREFFLMQYLHTLYRKQKYKKISRIITNYFSWLKRNKKRKSREFKIFYLSLMININSDQSNYFNVLLYGNYLLKYIPIKNNILSNKYNNDFNINSVYGLDKKFYPFSDDIVSYYIFCSFIDISISYYSLQLFDFSNDLSNYFISHLPVTDKFYLSFFQYKISFHINKGSIGDLIILNRVLNNIPENKNKLLYKVKLEHYISILKKDNALRIKVYNIHKNKSQYSFHATYRENSYERYIMDKISQKDFKTAFSLVIAFYCHGKKLECFSLLIFLFLNILKQNKPSFILNLNIMNMIINLCNDPLHEFYNFPEYSKLCGTAIDLLANLLKINENKLQGLSVFQVFIRLLKSSETEISKFNMNYNQYLKKLANKKIEISRYINSKLNQEKYSSEKGTGTPVPIDSFIEKYPLDPFFLSLFATVKNDKSLVDNIIPILEINLYKDFITELLMEFHQFYSDEINRKSAPEPEPKNTGSENREKLLFDLYHSGNRSRIKKFYFKYFSEYEKSELLKIRNSDYFSNSINFSELFYNLFSFDTSKKYINYIRTYILINN